MTFVIQAWSNRSECEVRWGPFGTDAQVEHFLSKLEKRTEYVDVRVLVVNHPNLFGTGNELVDEVYG